MSDDLAWLAGERAAPVVLAEIHATVDLERALAAAGLPPEAATRAVEDPLLGARVVVILGRPSQPIAVAEPSTEGRLAATLARHAEGAAGRYVRSPVGLADAARRAAAAGIAVSRPAFGPFGSEILVLDGSSSAGPHTILVDPRAVPSPR